MLTLKESLCLLALVGTYGITGRSDFDAARVPDPARQSACPAGAISLVAADSLAEDGPNGRPEAGCPPKGTDKDVACAASARPAGL